MNARWRLPAYMPPMPRESVLRQTYRALTDASGLFLDAHRERGDAFTIHIIGYGRLAVFCDEDSIKQISAGKPEDFGHVNDLVGMLLGVNSIMLLNGESHKHARRRTLSAFRPDRIQRYATVMKRAADRFIDGLSPGERVSAMNTGTIMALEIILVALFGLDRGPEYDRLARLIRSFMDGGHNPLATLTAYLVPPDKARGVVLGDRDPHTMAKGKMSFLARVFGLLPNIRDGRELNEALLELVAERQAQLDDGSEDAMSHVLRTARDEGHTYDVAAAFDEALTLVLAGYDTTAITLSRALYRMAINPRVAAKLRAEIDEAFPGRPLDPAALEGLPYLEACVMECLRLDALARGPVRRLRRPMSFAGYDLPEGTIVMAYVYPRQRDKDLWESPDDFYPEQMVGRRLRPHEFAPFGAGFRRCVGAAFATYELKVLLAQIVRRVDFCVASDEVYEEGMLGPMIGLLGPVPVDIQAVHPEHGEQVSGRPSLSPTG